MTRPPHLTRQRGSPNAAHPTLIPSSMSVGATWSLRSTTNLANCLTLMMYLGSSESALMILVHLETNACFS